MDVWIIYFQGGTGMSDMMNAYVQNTYAQNTGWQQDNKSTAAKKSDETQDSKEVQKTRVSGRTYGDAKLSKKAAEYYEKLKKKFGNADFVLVDADKIDEAKKNIGQFASNSSMVVLVDTEKIERMAVDEEYRKKYESIISNASNQLGQIVKDLQKQYGPGANKIKQVGMSFDDGGNASFFAVVDKSLKAQRERIDQKRKDKAEEAKKTAKEEAQERRAKRAEKGSANKTDKADDKYAQWDKDDVDIITADSLKGLYDKLSNILYDDAADNVQAASEKYVGQSVDYTA